MFFNKGYASYFIGTICGDIMGYAYPIYASVKAVQTDDVAQHTQWVMYWAVNACFTLIEIFADVLIAWIPFYYETKIAFITWLVLPQFQGATKLFQSFLSPSFVLYEQQIDESIDVVKARATEKFGQIVRETAEFAVRKSSGILVAGQKYIVTQALQNATNNLIPPSSKSEEVTRDSEMVENVQVISNDDYLMKDSFLPKVTSFISKVAESIEKAKWKMKKLEIENQSSESDLLKESVSKAEMKAESIEKLEWKMRKPEVENQSSERNLFKELAAEAEIKVESTENAEWKIKKLEIENQSNGRNLSTESITTAEKKSVDTESKDEKDYDIEMETVGHRDNNLLFTQFRLLMIRGVRVKKYGLETGPRSRVLRINSTSTHLIWESPRVADSQKSISLMDIYQLVSGNESKGFHVGDYTSHSNACFTIQSRKGNLDFQTESCETRNLLIAGLRFLIASRKSDLEKAINVFNKARQYFLLRQILKDWKQKDKNISPRKSYSPLKFLQIGHSIFRKSSREST